MVSDQNIAQLLEMGFTQEQAHEALLLSGNDVEQALAYLFNEGPLLMEPEIESLAGPPTVDESQKPRSLHLQNIVTKVQLMDSSMSDFLTSKSDNEAANDQDENTLRVYDDLNLQYQQPANSGYETGNYSTSQPPLLPQRPQYSRTSSNSKNIGGYIDDDLRETLSSYVDGDLPQSSTASQILDYNVFSDLSKHQRPDYLPPVLLPGMRNLFEAYFAPLLMILHEVTSFRNAVLEKDFKDYGFNKNWYKGERIVLPDDISSRFILETQRLLAFLDGDSERFFTSIKNLTESIPDGLVDEIERVETVDELVSCIYTWYVKELKESNDLVSAEVDRLFHCRFHTPNQSEDYRSCFPIEFEQIRGNMYQSLHNIIIGENMERANAIDISQFSDVITIPILNPEAVYNVTSSQGISVPEVFYPQIYSKSFGHIYNEVLPQLSELRAKRQQVAKSRQTLTSFRGQNIGDALRASLEALNSEIDDLSVNIELNQSDETEKLNQLIAAAQDLEKFCKSFNDKTESLRKEWFLLNQEIDSFDMSNEINSRMLDTADKYILIGAIFDESNFYYLTKDRDPSADNANQWIKVQYSNTNFHLENSSFDEVSRHIMATTSNASDFSSAIVLIYSKLDTWNNLSLSRALPKGLVKFLTEDRAHLQEMLSYVDEASSDSVSNEEEDEVDEYVESISKDDHQGFHKLEDDDGDLLELDSPRDQANEVSALEDEYKVIDID